MIIKLRIKDYDDCGDIVAKLANYGYFVSVEHNDGYKYEDGQPRSYLCIKYDQSKIILEDNDS